MNLEMFVDMNNKTISKTWLGNNMEYMSKFPDKFFDLAYPDPPYGIGYAEDAAKKSGTQFGKAAAAKSNYILKKWDNEIPKPEYFKELFRVSKNQIIWGGNYMVKNIEPTNCWIVWDKDNGSNNFGDCELAWTSFKSPIRIFKYTWNGMIQGNMKHKENRIHPTQKPIALYKWLLKNYAKPGDKIFDSHLGSQSSRIAAYDLGLDFWGCEIDEDYFNDGNKKI